MLKRLLFVLLLSAAPVGAQELSGVLATNLQNAKLLAAGNHWQKLEILARKWVETDKASWESWYYLGLSRFRLSKTDDAIKALSISEKLVGGARNTQLLSLLADVQVKKKDWVAVEVTYRRLLNEKQSSLDLWSKLLLAITSQEDENKRADEAAVLKKLLGFAAHINDIEYWRRYAALLLELERIAEVRDAYQSILRLEPGNFELVEWVYRYDLEHDDARLAASQEHLLRLDPENPLVLIRFARQALAEKRVKPARDYFRTISENEKYPPEQAEALVGLANLTTENNYSLEKYLAAIKVDPAYLPAWEGAVVALRSARRHLESKRYRLQMGLIKRRLQEGLPIPPELAEDF